MNRVDRWAGNLSYVFYITHTLAINVVLALLGKGYGTIPILIATLTASILLQRYVEEPVDQWRPQRTKASSRAKRLAPV